MLSQQPQQKTSPNLVALAPPPTREVSPLINALPFVNPANVSTFSNESYVILLMSQFLLFSYYYRQPKRPPTNHIDLLSLEDPVPTPQEIEEKRRQEIEKRVREELEEKHRQEIEQ
jgi:hypothetical protein